MATRAIGAEEFAGHTERPTTRHGCHLDICPTCRSQLVLPTDWAPAGRTGWWVELRCPDCDWSGGGVYEQDIVDRFDEALDRGTDAILSDLTILARANMEAEVDRFVEALDGDHILPEDF